MLTIGNTGPRFRRAKTSSNGAIGFRPWRHSAAIGLNLARELARLHGGELRLVRSESDSTDRSALFHRKRCSCSYMKAQIFTLCIFACTACAFDIDDTLDRLDSTLTISGFQDNFRARLSGTVDLEFYNFQQPAPSLIDSEIDNLFNPRLTLFLDAQVGSQVYFFSQARLDRGFDPTDHGADVRLDEYALRITPWQDGRFTLQVGKFATVVGNWVPRHLPWDNPFISAPLVYENVTAIPDEYAPYSPLYFIYAPFFAGKYAFNPVIWGPDCASGISVSGRLGRFDYAVEMKNASLSSRPESWYITENGFENPTFSSRVGFRPNEAWNFGFSGSEGPYFRREAESSLPPGRDISDYREFVLGQDISFAWHHLQLWAEFYEARFEVPECGRCGHVCLLRRSEIQIYAAAVWRCSLEPATIQQNQ